MQRLCVNIMESLSQDQRRTPDQIRTNTSVNAHLNLDWYSTQLWRILWSKVILINLSVVLWLTFFAIFLAENNLGKYFQENWFNCTEMWAMVHRSSVMTITPRITLKGMLKLLNSAYGLTAIASTP